MKTPGIERWILEWASKTPAAIAVTDGTRELTYAELAAAADQLAARLTGAGPEVLIGIALEASAEFIIAMAATLRTGAAYLPIDLSYPRERIRFMVEDSRCALIITDRAHSDLFAGGALVLIDDPDSPVIPQCFVDIPDAGDRLMYVIYTSGSTGRPKGVEVTQNNLIRLFEQTEHLYGFTEADVWTLFHSTSFDFSVWEIWGALRYGGRLVIVPRDVRRDPLAFRELVERERVTVLNQTPSAFRMFIRADGLRSEPDAGALRFVIFGGEALDFRSLRPWFDRHGSAGPKLVNMYGITETTVHVTYKTVESSEVDEARSLMGSPIPDLAIRLCNPGGEDVAPGEDGEIWVGGAGVARGYLGRSELTAEKFVEYGGQRFYKSGDLARVGLDGEMEYRGRIDDQVKLRGFRIELGEIEAIIRGVDGVTDAAVALRAANGTEPALIGYVVLNGADIGSVEQSLRTALPEYMRPSELIALDRLPLTAHGKLDRNALPAPASEAMAQIQFTGTAARVADLYRAVLGPHPLELDSNFFALGGTSLQAMLLTLRVAETERVALPSGAAFKYPTIAAMSSAIDAAAPLVVATCSQNEGWAALSPSQQQMWIAQMIAPESAAFHCAVGFEIAGALDIERLAGAVKRCSMRHPALRLVFEIRAGKPMQRVVENPTFEVEIGNGDVNELVKAPFELGKSAGRAFVFLDGMAARFVLVLHHVITDGWSMGRLLEEIADEYNLKTVQPPRADFLALTRDADQNESKADEAAYAADLTGAPRVAELPTEFSRPATRLYRSGRVRFTVHGTEQFAKCSHAEAVTPNSIFLGALAALVHRYARQNELVVGIPYAGRDQAGSENVQGLLMNLVAVNVRVSQSTSFRELCREVAGRTARAASYAGVPFSKVAEKLNSPLRILFAPQPEYKFDLASLTTKRLSVDTGSTPYDVVFCVAPSESGFEFEIVYAADLFSHDAICDLVGQYQVLLNSAVANPETAISELEMFRHEERDLLLSEWSGRKELDSRGSRTLPSFLEVFARVVSAHSSEEAICFGEQSISYEELDAWSNRIANALAARGAARETLVAISCERSPAAMAAVLGVWKSGAAYVPLDPFYPAERLSWMLRDCGAPILLASPRAAKLLETDAKLVLLDDTLLEFSSASPYVLPELDSLAYVIYTSGSTGVPKGVEIEHRGVAALTAAILERSPLAPGSRILQYTSLSFDVCVGDILSAFAQGATMVIPSQSHMLAGPELLDVLDQQRITQALLPMSVIAQLEPRPLPHLKRLVSGGERCPATLVDRWSVGRDFINAYGPTEASVGASVHRCVAGEGDPPIGRPLPGWTLYVLDENQRVLPALATGELYIGGDGLARGYLGRHELTAERFIDGTGEIGERLYRTGDLARWRRDGTLEFIGRADDQHKVRGFRIELGEIETALLAHPKLLTAVAVVEGEGPTARVVAYAVPREDVPSSEVLLDLRATLPAQLVPSAIVFLDAIPLTPNGKLDRAALPQVEPPEEVHAVAGTERLIVEAWGSVLNHDSPRAANFFDAGGTSLGMVQLQAEIESRTGTRLTLAQMFGDPTIEGMSRLITPVATMVAKLKTELRREEQEQIAIVGMAARFPGAPDVDTFWKNLCRGLEGITRFTREELEASGVAPDLLDDPSYIPARGIIAGADMFDAGLFGISPREAERMDPQQRIWLECALTALEDAAIDPQRYPGSIGVFCGIGAPEYLAEWAAQHGVERDDFLGLGNDKDFSATRVSYKLGLRGPSMSIQTACSTSLVAVQIACEQLLLGECDAAIAGAASLNIPLHRGYQYREGMILSPDGHCRPFDRLALGTVPGDGVGAVVLKRLSDAICDRDDIYAVIAGGAVNNDGSAKAGYTAPSVTGQKDVISKALRKAGVPASSITFVEAHGTGTPMGDPIEFAALREVFEADGAALGQCVLGSVKSNVGHLNTAAGIAGLIKTALALKHQAIPGTLHFESPNPELSLEKSPFIIGSKWQSWDSEGPRFAGVSSFGVGGTNAHLILTEAPLRIEAPLENGPELLAFSAASASAVELMARDLASYLEDHDVPLASVARTLQMGRMVRSEERFVIASNREEAIRKLREIASGAGPESSFEDHISDERSSCDLLHLPTYPFERQRHWGLPQARPEMNWLSEPVLKEVASDSSPAPERWIVFGDDFRHKHCASLPADTVYASETSDRANIEKLLEANRGQRVRCVHAVFAAEPTLEDVDALLQRTYFSIVALAQAQHRPSELILISNSEAIGRSLAALARVIASEFPDMRCRHFLVADRAAEYFVGRELHASFEHPGVILSGSKRFVPAYEAAPAAQFGQTRLRSGGVYLITGGTGGMGLAIAEHLAVNYKASLVLASRHGAEFGEDAESTRRFEMYQHARTRASSLDVLSLDVSDAAQAHEFVQFAIRKHGRIDGVIHAAGVTGGGILHGRTEKQSNEILRSKVHGTLALEHALAGVPHDFLFLCSSLTALGAVAGQADYAAANAFLDGFAAAANTRGRRVVSVNWDGWSEAGAFARSGKIADHLLTPADGVRVFELALSGTSANFAVSKVSLARRAAPVRSEQATPIKGDVEHPIAAIWRDHLGVDSIGMTDDFFDLGGDSLLAVQIAYEIRSKLGIDVPAHAILEHPTVREFCSSLGTVAPKHLVQLAEGDASGSPIFLVHPIGGHVYFYLPLAKTLAHNGTVYGLQAQGVDGEAPPLETIEAMAEQYIAAMRTVQPHGPYRIGGSSFGGVVCFEMAQQLAAAGESLELIALIDTPAPWSLTSFFRSDAEILAYLLARGEDPTRHLAALSQTDEEGMLRYFLTHGGGNERLAPGATTDSVRHFLRLFRTNFESLIAYRPKPSSFSGLFFQATDHDSYNTSTYMREWQPLFGYLEMISVEGNHTTMNLYPNCQTIADRISQQLSNPQLLGESNDYNQPIGISEASVR